MDTNDGNLGAGDEATNEGRGAGVEDINDG